MNSNSHPFTREDTTSSDPNTVRPRGRRRNNPSMKLTASGVGVSLLCSAVLLYVYGWFAGWFQAHPFMVFGFLFMIYKKWEAGQPWPDYGGRITSVHSVAEWDALLKSSGSKLVVVDAYALWCPPCKAAAPTYAQMSEAFSPDSVTFAKFNTDEAGDLARQLGITAMPTFKLFKGGVEVDTLSGRWGQLAGLLKKHGAKDATKKAD